jgi:hypothetical protein
MSERNDEEKRALKLISDILRECGSAFQFALIGRVDAVLQIEDARNALDGLESVIRRIKDANYKPPKPPKMPLCQKKKVEVSDE